MSQLIISLPYLEYHNIINKYYYHFTNNYNTHNIKILSRLSVGAETMATIQFVLTCVYFE